MILCMSAIEWVYGAHQTQMAVFPADISFVWLASSHGPVSQATALQLQFNDRLRAFCLPDFRG